MSDVDNGKMLYICGEQCLWEIFVPSSQFIVKLKLLLKCSLYKKSCRKMYA